MLRRIVQVKAVDLEGTSIAHDQRAGTSASTPSAASSRTRPGVIKITVDPAGRNCRERRSVSFHIPTSVDAGHGQVLSPNWLSVGVRIAPAEALSRKDG